MKDKKHKGTSFIKLIAMNRMQGWRDDTGELCNVFREVLGLLCEEHELTL